MDKVTYSSGQFQWLNPHWSPTKLEDVIWARTGFEDKFRYLAIRRRYLTLNEIAEELGIQERTIEAALYRRFR